MSKDYSKLINDAITRIQEETGYTQEQIAHILDYTPSYISKAIKGKGTKNMLANINKTFSDFLKNHVDEKPTNDQALLKELLSDYVKFKAQITKRSAEEIAEEIYQNTRLALLQDKNKK